MDSNSKAHDEYSILAENLRHYENLFFANLAAFLTINGGMLSLVFAFNSTPLGLLAWVRGAGVLTAVVFGGHCGIYLARMYRLARRAIELEETKLHYKQYQLISPPKAPKVGACLWLAMFFFVLLFWCFAPLSLPMRGEDKPKISPTPSGVIISSNAP